MKKAKTKPLYLLNCWVFYGNRWCSTTGRATRPALTRLAHLSPNQRATTAPSTFFIGFDSTGVPPQRLRALRERGDNQKIAKTNPLRASQAVVLSVLAKDLEWHGAQRQNCKNKPTFFADSSPAARGRFSFYENAKTNPLNRGDLGVFPNDNRCE
jgi:hypothetical protein